MKPPRFFSLGYLATQLGIGVGLLVDLMKVEGMEPCEYRNDVPQLDDAQAERLRHLVNEVRREREGVQS